ncbi:MAG: CPBP family intramembrane metalloprotease [Lachnospiraceae bacterium]|nr:CPBP family intramembrane metalloprotease [Lachnospiraceae bacterium]
MSNMAMVCIRFLCLIAFFSLIYIYVFIIKEGKTLKLPGIRVKDIFIFIILGFVIQISGSRILTLVLESTGESENYNNVISGMMSMTPLMILYVCLLGPLMEEFLFRGVIFSYLKKIFPFFFADILQAVSFGIYHKNIYQGIYAFILGSLLGLADQLYDSIVPSVIIHISINFAGLFILRLLEENLGYMENTILFCICLVIVAVLTVRFIIRAFRERS